jgi:hypothetical protein
MPIVVIEGRELGNAGLFERGRSHASQRLSFGSNNVKVAGVWHFENLCAMKQQVIRSGAARILLRDENGTYLALTDKLSVRAEFYRL